MAIILQEQKNKTNWFSIVVFMFLFAIVIIGGYYLFFAPVPGIDIIIPAQLQSTSQLSQIQFNPSEVINNPVLKTLRQYGALPTVGNLGRDNPFLSF